MKQHITKRIDTGVYQYRGYTIGKSWTDDNKWHYKKGTSAYFLRMAGIPLYNTYALDTADSLRMAKVFVDVSI